MMKIPSNDRPKLCRHLTGELKERIVDLGTIVSELKKQRDQLDRAITALEEVGEAGRTTVKSARPAAIARTAKKRGHSLTPEGRKRLSQLMKRRWAERRKKIAPIGKLAKKAA
jgi:hypothetical protein